MDPILVIGHKNPDTDAICAAIGYAAYLRDVRGMDAVPACCGELNVRTTWVLKKAGLPAPRLVLDVRPTAEKICRRDVVTASADETFLSVYQKMLAHGFRSIPVVDAGGCLQGLPAIQELAQLFLPQEGGDAANRRVRTSLRNMQEALGARLCTEENETRHLEDLVLVVAASSVDTARARAGRFPSRQLVFVTGDRPEIHILAMEIGARALVITGGFAPCDNKHIVLPGKVYEDNTRPPADKGPPLKQAGVEREKPEPAHEKPGATRVLTPQVNESPLVAKPPAPQP